MYCFTDMHCDTLYQLRACRRRGKSDGLRSRNGHLDLLRLKEAGYLMQTFGMFVCLEEETDPTLACVEMADIFDEEMAKNSDLIRPVTTAAEVIENSRNGKMSALLSIEEGGVCRGDIRWLREFYRRGVRMMTLTWNYENELGWPSKIAGAGRTGTYGLKEKGLEFIAEMERLGILIDVSHLSDDGFYDVCAHTKKPFIASHSNARTICSHTRNLTDDMIRRIAERGGVTGLNFCGDFTEPGKKEDEGFATIEGLIQHVRHIVNVGGIGCIGFGTDYDGIGDEIEVDNCLKMPLLADRLKKAGFHESEIDAMCFGNVLRVMRDVL